MAILTANSTPFDIVYTATYASLLGLFESSDIVINTSTQLQIRDPSTGEVLTLNGTFGAPDLEGYPTTGTITGGSYTPGTTGFGAFTITNMSMTVELFRDYVSYDNTFAFFTAAFQGNDTFNGTAGGDRLYGFAGHDTLEGFSGNDELWGDGIEGAAGNDLLIGGAGADTLIGGGGNDIFSGSMSQMNGDTITDYGRGDRIVLTDANISTFSFSILNKTLSFGGGSLTLSYVPTGRIVASAYQFGGVQLSVLPGPLTNDINGDHRSDFIVRDSQSGWLSTWGATSNGSFTANNNSAVAFPLDWKVVGTGDYNGDGRVDMMLRNTAGWLTDWLGNSSGGYTNNGANTSLFFAPEWKVVGNGDFNGDGKSDLLLRRDDGWMTNWLGTSNGNFTNNGANTSLFFSNDWKIVSTGDFNGDGNTDLLLRRDDGWLTNWLGNASGGFSNNGANTSLFFSTDWKVIGTGDINGDGKDDLLLRRDDGWMTDWLGTVSGGFTNNGANTALYLTTDWKIASIGDFNGDGREDILLRNDSGWMTDWLGTQNGSFTNNGAAFSTYIASNWGVQDPFL
jgi:hypothetical protein